MNMLLQKIISALADLSIIVPGILLIKGGSTANKSYLIITYYVAITVFRNILTLITAQFGIYNIFIYNWHNLLAFVLVALLYYTILGNRYFKIFSVVTITVSTIIALFDYQSLFDIQTVNFNRFSYNTSGCFTIILILLYFYELIQRLQVPNLTKYPLFWFSAGALLYYAGTIFSYIFIENTFNSTIELRQQYWMIDSILAILFNIFLGFSIWYMKPAEIAR